MLVKQIARRHEISVCEPPDVPYLRVHVELYRFQLFFSDDGPS